MFQAQLARDGALIGQYLDDYLAAKGDLPLHSAMRYGAAGGKRLRGFLVLQSARMLGVAESAALPAAAAIEAMHAYSLIHDDLPAMDNDDLRRGLPTVHVKWDEATAILAGDALQTLAFELLCDAAIGSAEVRLDLCRSMAQAAGGEGMVLGQAQDIAAETAPAPLTLEQITALQAGKTGALIEWSAMAGARMAGADLAPLRAYARALGLAFQIADDILDVAGDEAQTGKRLGKDASAGKATFVSLLGLGAARAQAQDLVDAASAALAPYGAAADLLIEAARFTVTRHS
ncbi:MAG: farnesyl diphosphate synthase [Cypionkella sp.]|nr:farnesyl diphosphate synthase [Cypionkella sp.]